MRHRTPLLRRLGATHVASILALFASAQVLRVPFDSSDPTQLAFDPSFIQRNGVLSISGRAQLKRDGEPMRERNESTLYRFDEGGHLTYNNIMSLRPGGARDTTSVEYTYDAAGHCIEAMHNDLNGFFCYRYTVDSLGRVTGRRYMRVENLGADRSRFTRGGETAISEEHCVYGTVNDTAVRRVWNNELGLPYREEVLCRDRWGYLRAVHERNLITGRMGTTSFRYDEKGRPAERIDQPDMAAPPTQKYTWHYDQAGNVVQCDLWRDDRQVRHTEYLYEEGTMLLKAVLSKDMTTGIIHVMQYTTARR